MRYIDRTEKYISKVNFGYQRCYDALGLSLSLDVENHHSMNLQTSHGVLLPTCSQESSSFALILPHFHRTKKRFFLEVSVFQDCAPTPESAQTRAKGHSSGM
jgi:hypothetical protein